MRTSMTNWFKFPLALLMCSMVMSVANAQDEPSETIVQVETSESQSQDDTKEKRKTRTKEEREALKTAKAEALRLGRFHRTQTAVEGFEPVDMYDGISNGDVEVTIKAKSSSDSNFFVKNLTDKPLAIRLPKAFSAVPVVRQFGGGGFGGRGGGGLGGGGLGGGGFGGGQFGGNQGSAVDSVVAKVAADSVVVVAEASEAVALVAECLTFLLASPVRSLLKPFA